MDVPLVNTFMGGDGSKNQDQNWEEALRVWPDIVAFANDHGRKITLENCPMLFSYDEWPGGHNIATTPRMWRRILEQWGDTIGLNFDPSHLVLQMIDMRRFLKEFGPHVLHYQAKDLMIDRDGLYERGVFSMGIGWQIPRIPGLGEVDWSVVFSELYRAGYEGDCIIEHEDRRFEGYRRQGQAGLPHRARRPPPVLQVAARPLQEPAMALTVDDLTEHDIAKAIDHSLLRPELDDAFVEDGCRLAARYDVASVCVRPADVRRAKAILDGTDVAVGTTIGFPHGNHPTEIKVFEAQRARSPTARPSSTWSSRSAPSSPGATPTSRPTSGRSSRSPTRPARSSRSSSRTPT